MLRGLISGVFFGAVISAAVIVILSVVAPQPPGREPPKPPQVEMPDVAGGTAPEAAPVTAPDGVDGAVELPDVSPDVTLPDAADAAPMADQEPAPAPATTQVSGDMAEPQEGADIAAVPDVVASVSGVSDEAAPAAPAAPAQDASPEAETAPAVAPSTQPELKVSEEPAQPEAVADAPEGIDALPAITEEAAPRPGADGSPSAPQAPAAGVDETAALPSVDDASRPVALPGLAGGAQAEVEAPSLADLAPEPVSPSGLAAPQTEGVTIVVPEDEAVPSLPDGADPAPEVESDPAEEPEVAAAPEVGLSGTAASVMPESSDQVLIRRPGDAAAAEDAAAGPVPLVDFAADVPRAAAGLPRMSVVLVDDGRLPSAAAVVGAIPFPVTIAIDPSLPEAVRRSAAYRDAGIEILALADLPEGAAPQDGAAALEMAEAALGEHVGLLTRGSVMGSTVAADVSRYVAERLAEEGRGLVALREGLATPMRYAEAADLPAVEIYRDLGEAAQEARVIRRFLDQAAFRARQESGIVVLGRLKAETITALMLWSGSDRAKQVGLVPVSAVLRGE